MAVVKNKRNFGRCVIRYCRPRYHFTVMRIYFLRTDYCGSKTSGNWPRAHRSVGHTLGHTRCYLKRPRSNHAIISRTMKNPLQTAQALRQDAIKIILRYQLLREKQFEFFFLSSKTFFVFLLLDCLLKKEILIFQSHPQGVHNVRNIVRVAVSHCIYTLYE